MHASAAQKADYHHRHHPDQAPGSMVGRSIDGGNLQFTRLIGVGTYGEVYHAVDRRSGDSYAVKVLPRKPSHTRAPACSRAVNEPFIDARLLSREVALCSRIPRHSNIIGLVRMLHTQDQLFMVMEHCSGGDLYENISKNPYFRLAGNDALVRRLFLQLVSAIAHCHRHGVYHRDIKPENVLVSRDGLNVKLIDFGLATSDPWCREIGCGSAYYMSPECQGGIATPVDRYAAAPNDVWALGVILINLTTGRNPWNRAHITDPLFRRFLADKSFLCQAIRATPSFAHIIHRVLDPNPDTRCTLDELHRLVKYCPRFVEPLPRPQTFPHECTYDTHRSFARHDPHRHPQTLFLDGMASPVSEPSVAGRPAPTAVVAPAEACTEALDVRLQPKVAQQQQHPAGTASPQCAAAPPEQFVYLPLRVPGLGEAAAAAAAAAASSHAIADAVCASALLGHHHHHDPILASGGRLLCAATKD
ncbi:Serine/threonine protein kinase [Coemansia javaensis]|uniref:non-specific serine/threonine protein kinase n=1 Tax=Coemansia javaensis TaxID=2761396 RepID=A0A9W8H0C9_9FUNG|nr:Serine/threonine protein kinase [Coemansia javaensis]